MDGSSTKYYPNNRFHFDQLWEKRIWEDELETMKDIEMQPSVSAKLRRAKETGYTGLTLLGRLYDLYKFNPFTDMVHDVMHLVLLNLVRKLFTRFFEDDQLNLAELNNQLQSFPFPTGLCFFLICSLYFYNKEYLESSTTTINHNIVYWTDIL